MLRQDIEGREVAIEVPPEIGSDRALLEAEKAEFEAVFGAPVRFVGAPPPNGPRWVVQVDQTQRHSSLRWDKERLI